MTLILPARYPFTVDPHAPARIVTPAVAQRR